MNSVFGQAQGVGMRVEHRTGGRRELVWIGLIALFGIATLLLLILPGILAA